MADSSNVTAFLQRSDGRLAYDVSGSGPPIVAAPGMGDLRASYRFLIPGLVRAGYRIATMDLRGHGQSSTGWQDYSESAIAEDMIALVDHLAAPGEKAVLMGSSFGGAAAVIAAARRPDRVAAVVLLAAFVRDVPQTAAQRAAVWTIAHTPVGRWIWTAYVPSLYPGTKPSGFVTHLDALKTNLAEPGRFTAVAAMLCAGHATAAASLPHVTAPALVVMGTDDPDFPDPAAEAQLTAERIAGPADILLVDGAGHYPHVQRPDAVYPELKAFLLRVAPTGGAGTATRRDL